ncbi:thiamine pyrophosphate-requiring protein [Thermodesulfobacteriota bacterium]
MIEMNNVTVAEAYLELLSLRGIDCFFANAGTDFASLVEAFAIRQEQGKERPRPLTIPHEIPLVSMAHGYYLATGRPQVAMVHTGIGTANGLGPIMGAQRGRVPILYSAGRTPITEEGSPASRARFIHWGQESFDQAAMVREYVKWDYELRTPSQLETVVDRALAMAMSEPKGPVYLTLPREVLAEPIKKVSFRPQHRYDLPTFHPDPEKVREAADLLAKAKFPIIITSSVGRSPGAVREMINLAEAGAIGVISPFPDHMNFPPDHPCHQGFMPEPLIAEADVILVVDCDVPWHPNQLKPKDSTVIIQAGIDPFFSSYPIRSFPSDLTLQGDPIHVLPEITRCLKGDPKRDQKGIDLRMGALKKSHDGMVKGWKESASKSAKESPLDFQWVSHQVSQFLGEDTVVIEEALGSGISHWANLPGSYFFSSHMGYLGWCLGAALGIKLGSPEKTVIATVGDGAYMFGVPSACHFVSNAYQIPILIVIYNNQSYYAVKRATQSLHPDGRAVGNNLFPLSDLQPTANFEKICEAFGGYGERVESPDEVGPALKRGLHAVKIEKRQAVLNMICKKP